MHSDGFLLCPSDTVPETPHDQGVDHDPSPSTAAPESVTMVDHSITSTKVDYSAATESNGKEG